MKLKKRVTQKLRFDPTLATLMATGMAGLAGVARHDEAPDEQSEQAEAQALQDAPTLNETPFADPILPAPPRHAPSQRNVFNQQEAEHLLIADLLPPVTPPPPPQEEDEEMTEEDNDEMMLPMADDAPTASGNIDQPRGQASPGNMDFSPPTPQEEALWDCFFNDVNVPQNEVAPPYEVPLNRDVTEARLLLEVSFGDAVLDAGGFVLRMPHHVPLEEELVRIENGNEVWLVADIDLNDHAYLSNLPVSIISLADPTLFRILDIYVGPSGDTTFEDTYFTADTSEEGEAGFGEESGENNAADIEIPLNRQITTSRKLTEIGFDDAALNAGGITIDVRGAKTMATGFSGLRTAMKSGCAPILTSMPCLSFPILRFM